MQCGGWAAGGGARRRGRARRGWRAASGGGGERGGRAASPARHRGAAAAPSVRSRAPDRRPGSRGWGTPGLTRRLSALPAGPGSAVLAPPPPPARAPGPASCAPPRSDLQRLRRARGEPGAAGGWTPPSRRKAWTPDRPARPPGSYPVLWGRLSQRVCGSSAYAASWRGLAVPGAGAHVSGWWPPRGTQREGVGPWLPLKWGDTLSAGRTEVTQLRLLGRAATAAPRGHPGPQAVPGEGCFLTHVCSLTPRALAQRPLVNGGPGGCETARHPCQGWCWWVGRVQSGRNLLELSQGLCLHVEDGGPSQSAPRPLSSVSRALSPGHPAIFCQLTAFRTGLWNIRALEPDAKGRLQELRDDHHHLPEAPGQLQLKEMPWGPTALSQASGSSRDESAVTSAAGFTSHM
nr:uncharacterized protein LOC105106797 [Camelus dromedarius]XP_031297871.1 uncharacterized protein LOC105106797 [Camelus dromedarius]XP_031297872.1 uncharacterized protein LOC105106797 [Camelus dromedarius]XP_031297873.1 uncharacterized protein LOC105106797 [Camelus dromedarius]XP_031297874.1 uncharacterized protein LOC105106797 [Camelus dromedarius]XP_031297875.1 uncharacterized protein LOC105106797 [Camelus dromedarius]XP_031297876.1 uncharacterized protein LOC105106797 [Camelus dromedariu